MDSEYIELNSRKIGILRTGTAIIGSGCAGFNTADCLYDLGERNFILFTESINSGTSRNTGSDKQTYYKLSLAGSGKDSVEALAESLFSGGSMDGYNALAEAAGSAESFFKLSMLGVPFPKNEFGEFSGYKTDHDEFYRATSCGPYTSKIMTEKLETSVIRKNIRIFDKMTAVKLLTRNNKIYGVLFVSPENAFTAVLCENVVLCTGGSSSVYMKSVYPENQTGAGGLAAQAGAEFSNLQEWQYGLASTGFKWNVSGSYQQVIPRYVSVDSDGTEHEFLCGYLSEKEIVSYTFLKGYQWPFDMRKIDGSSCIDLLVHNETVKKGRRVYLDYRQNPCFLKDIKDLGKYSPEAHQYLKKSGAEESTPLDRLLLLNPEAYGLYLDNGIDLALNMLEVAVCAQHNNGGVAVDMNSMSSVLNLYCAGEAAGVFGIYRPGGSALNSTQVGSRRAAEHIAYKSGENYICISKEILREDLLCFFNKLNKADKVVYKNHFDLRTTYRTQFDEFSSFVRKIEKMVSLKADIDNDLSAYFNDYNHGEKYTEYFKTYDMLAIQSAILSAMILTASKAGSRGGSFVHGNDKKIVYNDFIEKYSAENETYRGYTTRTVWEEGRFVSYFKPISPIPERENWFEVVWNAYKKRTGRA